MIQVIQVTHPVQAMNRADATFSNTTQSTDLIVYHDYNEYLVLDDALCCMNTHRSGREISR